MSNTASLNPVEINWASKSEWKVEIPESLSLTGRRRRYFFNTKEAAELFVRQQKSGLRLYGVEGGDLLSPSLQEQAVRAVEAIKPFFENKRDRVPCADATVGHNHPCWDADIPCVWSYLWVLPN